MASAVRKISAFVMQTSFICENVVGLICPALEQFTDETANLPAHRFRPPLVRLPGFSGVGFLFTSFSQAFKGGHLTKPEIFSANALGAVHNCCAIDARLRLCFATVLVRSRRGGALSQRFETRIAA
jgi:hypothetical protein